MPNRWIELQWLAGLLEGEGCFSIRKRGKNACGVSVKLQMTDGDVVRRAALLMGSKPGLRKGGIKADKSFKKPVYFTELTGSKATKLMEEILPLMGIRRSAKINEALIAYANRVTVSQAARSRERKPKLLVVNG